MWITRQRKPVADRLAMMQELLSLQGKVIINLPEWTGWR
jgi:hypothetical protein